MLPKLPFSVSLITPDIPHPLDDTTRQREVQIHERGGSVWPDCTLSNLIQGRIVSLCVGQIQDRLCITPRAGGKPAEMRSPLGDPVDSDITVPHDTATPTVLSIEALASTL